MKKPFLFASGAFIYIVIIVGILNAFSSTKAPDTIIIPIVMLSLFVLSAAVMGFLFLSEPFHLYMDNKKKEAVSMFLKIVGIFACYVALFVVLLFFISTSIFH